MHCPSCQHENPAEANFCLHCGTQLARVCPHCQHVLPPEARFCMACGQPLTKRQKGKRRKGETRNRRIGESEKKKTKDSELRTDFGRTASVDSDVL